jgi:hypothetical protein
MQAGVIDTHRHSLRFLSGLDAWLARTERA